MGSPCPHCSCHLAYLSLTSEEDPEAEAGGVPCVRCMHLAIVAADGDPGVSKGPVRPEKNQLPSGHELHCGHAEFSKMVGFSVDTSKGH